MCFIRLCIFLGCCLQIFTNDRRRMNSMNVERGSMFMVLMFTLGMDCYSSCVFRGVDDLFGLTIAWWTRQGWTLHVCSYRLHS